MALFKCKMCGGALEINNNESVATCEYCGTQQTLPKLDDEKRVNLYDRANHFRRNNEFDKAAGLYEQILNEDPTDAEAYWSLVLCRYGIEYVEDPASHKRVPTVNRAQFTSIFDDDNYKSAMQYADGYQKSLYEEEAKAINEIQKGILAISQKEEPFDVFICYKETDNNGRRTPDSVLANDLYHQLTQEGFKVFFARITLEDKLGSAYEPYIFAALNSAKVMVVLGTKPEFFNAVWVKNEWSRYLSLIKNGAKKMLIPAYKDMDPYDLPEEFSHLQAQDMSKLGFMQDLIRGIKKIAQADTPKATVVKETVISGGNANTAPLLKRAFMFLEDGDWNSANEYCEKVLDLDPENASAYLGKLMATLRVKKQEALKDQDEPFDNDLNFQKAIRFSNEVLKDELKSYIEHINTRNENARLNAIYNRAKGEMSAARTEGAYKEAARLFESISEYQDSALLATECYDKAEIARKDAILSKGKAWMTGYLVSNYEAAIKLFEQISGWKDADEKAYACQKTIEEIKAKQEADRLERERKVEEKRKEIKKRAKRNKRIAIITTPIVCAVIAFIILLNSVIIPYVKYNDAVVLMDSGKYEDAISAFAELGDYKDSADRISESKEKIKELKYGDAVALMDAGNLDEAYSIFQELGNYKDSAEKVISTRYLLATTQLENKEYQNAYETFSLIKDYEDSKDKYQTAGIGYAQAEISAKKYQSAIDILGTVGTFEGKSAMLDQCYTEGAKEFYTDKQYYSALTWYEKVTGYDKNADFYTDSCYNYAVEQIEKGKYGNALTFLNKAGNRDGVAEQKKAAKYGYVNVNKNNNNTITFEYLKELKAANYKDSASIYKDLYAWKVDIVVNDSKDDEKTDMSSISKYSNWYFHVNLSGGEPGAEIQVKYTGYFPNGGTRSDKWDSKWSDGWGGTCWFYYNTPVYGQQGTFRLKVFDGSGNLLGEKSVKITG